MINQIIKYISLVGISYTNAYSFDLSVSAADLLTDSIGAELANEVLNHGCWCTSMGVLKAYDWNQEDGDIKSIDELDGLCRSWLRARRCSVINDACSNADILLGSYDFENDGSCPDSVADVSQTCTQETCGLDKHFVEAISAHVNAVGFNAAEARNTTQCERTATGKKKTCDEFKLSNMKFFSQLVSDMSGLGKLCLQNDGFSGSMKYDYCLNFNVANGNVRIEMDQTQRSGNFENWNLGNNYGTENQWNSDFTQLYLFNGDGGCPPPNRDRLATVYFVCAAVPWNLASVTEPESCHYHVTVETKHMC